MARITFGPIPGYHHSDRVTHDHTKSVADWQMRTKRPLREPVRVEVGPRLKNYITPAGLQRLKNEHRFLLNRERPAVGSYFVILYSFIVTKTCATRLLRAQRVPPVPDKRDSRNVRIAPRSVKHRSARNAYSISGILN
jgi:hypothetical protein